MALNIRKCPKCGSMNIASTGTGYKCNNCGNLFEIENDRNSNNSILQSFENKPITANDFDNSDRSIVTYKCPNCSTYVVADANSIDATCYVCHSKLDAKDKVPGADAPNYILPFSINKDDAYDAIKDYVNKKSLLADPKFKTGLDKNKIMGIYFPYVIANISANASFNGKAETKVKEYQDKVNDKTATKYDAKLYSVSRSFDININGLMQSSVIENAGIEETSFNSILPFDTNNALKWSSGYLNNYEAASGDINIFKFKNKIDNMSKSIARSSANDTMNSYDRGVHWDNFNYTLKSEDYKVIYLPVWFYSYRNKNDISYVCLNGRNKNVSGKITYYVPKIILIGVIAFLFIILLSKFISVTFSAIIFISFIVLLIMFLSKYKSESNDTNFLDTNRSLSNLSTDDTFVKDEVGLLNSRIEDENGSDFSSLTIENSSNNSNVNKNNIIGNFFDKLKK